MTTTRPICLSANAMTPDYGLYLREEIYGARGWQPTARYDLFLSAFNLGERITEVHNWVDAAEKMWLVHEEYGLTDTDLPAGEKFICYGSDEATYCKVLIDSLI